MDKLLVLIVLTAIAGVVWKLRGDAAKQRKEVMARLATEREQRGGVDYSPTAELFREVGVRHDPEAPMPPLGRDIPVFAPPPVNDLPEFPSPDAADVPPPYQAAVDSAPVADPAPAASAEPVATEPGDLRTLFQGISMPAGLRPLGPLAPEGANFVTAAAPAEVHAGLSAEFERLTCDARWVEPTVAQTQRNGMRGLVTIYPNPVAALDLEGNPLFPGVEPGQVVVRMLAL